MLFYSYDIELWGWTEKASRAKGFLRNKGGAAWAKVYGLVPYQEYLYAVYQFAYENIGLTMISVNSDTYMETLQVTFLLRPKTEFKIQIFQMFAFCACVEEWVDGCTDGCTDLCTDVCTYECAHECTDIFPNVWTDVWTYVRNVPDLTQPNPTRFVNQNPFWVVHG